MLLLLEKLFNDVQHKLCNICCRTSFATLMQDKLLNIHFATLLIDRLCNIVARQDNVCARHDLQHCCRANFATLLQDKFFATFVSREALQYCCQTLSFAIFLHASYSRCDGMNLRQSFPMFPSSVSLARYYAFH